MKAADLIDRFTPVTTGLFSAGPTRRLPVLPRSAQALLAWSLKRTQESPIVLIAEGPQSLEILHRDLLTLAPSSGQLRYFPAWETLQAKDADEDADITGYRLEILRQLLEERARPLIATCVQALMQRTLGPEILRRTSFTLSVGKDHEFDSLAARFAAAGYAPEVQVQEKTQFSLRGGILDIWPPTEPWPLRIEFYGSTIESIRTFDPADQKSLDKTGDARIAPAGEWKLIGEEEASLLSYLPDDTTFIWSDMDAITDHAAGFEEVIAESNNLRLTIPFKAVQSRIDRFTGVRQLSLEFEAGAFPGSAAADTSPGNTFGIQPVGVLDMPREIFLPDFYARVRRQILDDLARRSAKGQTVMLFFDTQGALDHFRSELSTAPTASVAGLPEAGPRPPFDAISLQVGILSEGFVSDPLGMAVVAESDLYGRQKKSGQPYDPRPDRPGPPRITGARITDLTDIQPGDMVVHVEHGVGKYLGLYEIRINDQLQEVLTVEYAEGAKLHVPVSQAHLLSRYVGLSRQRVDRHRLGGTRWNKERAAAQLAIMDMASALLETQAQRSLEQGHAFTPDTPWQRDFEASFPYRETPDQHHTISAVKNDMESTRPMDRLVCGDAGYGKTEVAMRASFKAAMEGKQTAVLVPTTVLAQQHFDTFRERMTPFPIRVEMLSRFCPKSRQAGILKGLADGSVEIVIGTHALLQPGVHFKDLGLVIVDEEQRFGVRHKEWFKHLRSLVDVLTLTATPIPRTLYMSLVGARDMSLIQTAPRERMAIETIVARNSDEVVREAILREINRDGQVFYIHNRVMTIDKVKSRLERVAPEARIEIAHGQMASSELASTMRRFVAGQFNVLLCTTIVESGVDIPRANTILIDRADRFGIADLYQLRGRVGRSHHKAYAYLLLPAHAQIDPDARRRINAVKKFSHLSVGFKLALRDLEIRGAGNLLGAEQSGHIAAVGFDLYCQLLKRTVAQKKGETVPPIVDVELRLDFINLSPDVASPHNSAAIPYAYVEDENLRIALYRKMAESALPGDIAALRAELSDRFGPIPPPVTRLLQLMEIRILAASIGIRMVETRDGRLMLVRGQEFVKEGARFPRIKGTADDQLAEIIRHIRALS